MEEDVEVDTEFMKRRTNLLKHELHALSAEGFLSLRFRKIQNIHGGSSQNLLRDFVDVSTGITVFRDLHSTSPG